MSKEPILEIKQNEIKRLKASTVANPTNTIFVNLKITRYTRLIVMTDLFKNKNVRHSVDFNKINFNTDTHIYKLDDATYIGTVGSTLTDVSMDIYYIQEVVKDENLADTNIGYFVAFPTLLMIPDVVAATTRVIELQATVFGIDEDFPMMRSSVLEIPNQKNTIAYLKNINMITPTKLGNKLITFPGVEDDTLYTTTEIYVTNGQCNGDNTAPSQYIDLGTIDALVDGFDPLVGIDISVSTIKQTTHNAYAYSECEKVNMKSGSLCIPLNF